MVHIQLPAGGPLCGKLNRADPGAEKICTKADDHFGFVKMELGQGPQTVRLLMGIGDGRA